MFYKVRRASDNYNDANRPCKEAVKKKVPNYEHRTFKSFEEHDAKLGRHFGTWLSKGTEHKVDNTGISRRLEDTEEWVVRISSLKQLQDFIKEYGDVIVDEDSIIIYDSYIE